MKKSGLWIVVILVFAGIILGTLGTWSVPLGHGISAFWPAFVVQVAGGIWFGGWGVLAAVFFPIFTNALANVGWSGILGFIPANLAQGLIPAWAFRRFRVDPAIPGRQGLVFYAIWVAIIPAAAGGLIGSVAVILFGGAAWSEYPLLVVRWSVPNMAVSLLIGIPIMRELSSLLRDMGILVKDWWVFERISNQTYPQRFQDMPIQLKLVLAMGGAGLGPLLILSLLELIQNGGKTATGSMMPLLLSISMVTLVLAVGFLSQETVRPLQKLKEQVESLMHYRNKELTIERTDEIGQLGQAFSFLLESRRRADALLSASEEKYRTLFEHLPIPVFTKNREGEYTSCNAENEKYWAVYPVGRTDAELLDHETAAALREADLRVMETGNMLTMEECLPTTPLGERQVLSRKVPLRDGSGNIVGILGASVDITERKRAEEALQESEEIFSSFLEHSPVYVFFKDKDIRSLRLSKNYEQMLGMPLSDLLGKTMDDLFPSDLAKSMIADDLRILNDGKRVTVVEELNGRTYETTKFPIFHEGEPRMLAGFTLDITDRKRAEEALRESEAQLKTVMTNAPDTILWVDKNGLINYANRLMPGLTLEDVIGSSIYKWVPEEQHSVLTETFEAVFARGEHAEYESLGPGPHGESRIYSVRVAPVLIDNATVGAVYSAADITERKRKDEEITAHQAELQRLLQEANHSRRALLNVLEDQQSAEKKLRMRLAEMEAINHVSAALRVARTSDEMLSLLLDETLAALESEAGGIWLYQPENEELGIVAAHGWLEKFRETPIKPGEGITGTVFTSGGVYTSREFAADPLARPPSMGSIPSGWGGICIPIRAADEIAGVMCVSTLSPREITGEQTKLLISLAEMAGTALHRLRLHEETRRRLEYLQALRTIDQAIATNFDSKVTIDILLEQIIAKLHVDAAGVLLFHEYTSTLEYYAGRGFHTRVYEQSTLRLGEGIAGRAALERNTIRWSGFLEDRGISRITLLKKEGFKTNIAMPLIVKGELKGVLEVFHRKSLNPDSEWLGFLDALAGQTVIAIDNFQLFEGLQRSNMELMQAYDATIEGWSRALDLRDKETEGHTQRVTDLTLELAQKMGVPNREIIHVRRGALLHDIGKMGIPDQILLKPDKLTPEEWETMRRHATYAYELLYPIRYLRPALDIPHYHHEKWDGTGYPQGLKGEQIPLAARVFAVVDVWDALTNDRPYRPAWPEKDALDYIRQQSGKHFDPSVVEAFFGLLNLPMTIKP